MDKNEAKRALRAGQMDVLTLSCMTHPDEGISQFAKLAELYNMTEQNPAKQHAALLNHGTSRRIMKSSLRLIKMAVLVMLAGAIPGSCPVSAMDIYVATDGSDSWSGRVIAP
ncbi:MAG: hypothetical protein WCL16_11390, partial [bacterium]